MKLPADHLILVNERDEWTGTMDKMQAHEQGALHRAFSVFILNNNNELLLQQRAFSKYHSGGLWSNTCCSHPSPSESTIAGAHRRLKEEMGFDCPLEPIFTLRYKAAVGNGLIENEYDHIYLGYYNDDVQLNSAEAAAYRFLNIEEVKNWLLREPAAFTAWFHLAMPQFISYLQRRGIAA